MGTIPKALQEKQKKARQNTLEKIQNAIDTLNQEGYIITISLLMDRTNLSRSTFSKAHVEELLKINQIGKFKDRRIITQSKNEQKEILIIEKELAKSKSKIIKLEKTLLEKTELIQKLMNKLDETTEECQLLRYQLNLLMKKATILGLDLES